MRLRNPAATALLLVAACVESPSEPAPLPASDIAPCYGCIYQIENLGTLPGGRSSTASGINDHGVIVGQSERVMRCTSSLCTVRVHAFRLQDGVMTDLGTLPGDTESRAYDINNSGVIVGVSSGASGDRSFLWSARGGMTDLGTFNGKAPYALAINDSGVVTGWIHDNAYSSRAFRWSASTGFKYLSWAGYDSRGLAINAAGVVAGDTRGSGVTVAVRWSAGATSVLLPSNPSSSEASGINDAGSIVGSFRALDPSSLQGFVWTSSSGAIALAAPNTAVDASDVSNRNRVVGKWGASAFTKLGLNTRVLLPRLALNALLGDHANAVNLCGTIVGSAQTAAGEMRAVRWKKASCDP